MVTKTIRKVNVMTENCTLLITMPNGSKHHISVYSNGSIMVHALSGFTDRVLIGYGSHEFKVTHVNENGSVAEIKKSS